MADKKRAADTYRSARRAAWKAIPKAERPSWAEHNNSPSGARSGRGNGGGKLHPAMSELARHGLRPIGGFRTRYGNPTGEFYGNGGGKRESRRHAHRSDGPMHGPMPIHERNEQAALFDMPKARKPRRKAVAS